MSRHPVMLAMSILAALQVLAGTASLADLIGARPAAILILVVAALQAGVQVWVSGQVTPLIDPRDSQGRPLVPLE